MRAFPASTRAIKMDRLSDLSEVALCGFTFIATGLLGSWPDRRDSPETTQNCDVFHWSAGHFFVILMVRIIDIDRTRNANVQIARLPDPSRHQSDSRRRRRGIRIFCLVPGLLLPG
jgi:hypothetical protein